MSDEIEIQDTFLDPYSDIAAAHNALSAIEGLDSFDKEERAKIAEVRKMGLEIIYGAIQIIHSFYAETETN